MRTKSSCDIKEIINKELFSSCPNWLGQCSFNINYVDDVYPVNLSYFVSQVVCMRCCMDEVFTALFFFIMVVIVISDLVVVICLCLVVLMFYCYKAK